MKRVLIILGTVVLGICAYSAWRSTRPALASATILLSGPAPRSDLAMVTEIVRSPDARLIATISDSKTVKLWDAKTGQFLQTLEGEKEWFFSPSFSPDSALLATASSTSSFGKQYGHVQLWNPVTGGRVFTVDGIDWPQCVRFSPLGNFIAVGANSDLYVVDASTYTVVEHIQRPFESGVLLAMNFDPSANLLATAGQNGTVKLWKMPLLEPVRTFSVVDPIVRVSVPGDERGPVPAASVTFSHDGKLLAANNAEGTVYIWDVASGDERMRYAYGELKRGESLYASIRNSLAFTADDQWLVTTDRTGSGIRLLGVSSKAEIATPLTTHGDAPIVSFDASLLDDTVAFAYGIYGANRPPAGKYEIWTLQPYR
jgi:WD40 repeat protein